MKLLLLFLSVFLFQDQIPFKPNSQFEINLDFKFKPRPYVEKTVEFEAHRTSSSAPLPYLYLNIKVLKLDVEELRWRIENNKGTSLYSKKAEEGMVARLDLGFTDDIKDRVSSHEYIVYFVGKDKKLMSRILIHFDEDGTYHVNQERRGKL